MKKGIQSTAYIGRYEPLDSALSRMKRHGYDCMDYQDFIDENSMLYSIDRVELKSVLSEQRKAFDSHGLSVSQLHGPWKCPFYDDTKEQLAERFDKMVTAIYATSLLGAKYFVIHNIMPRCEDEEFIDKNFKFFSALAKEAKENDVIICMENMPFGDQPLARPHDLIKFVKELSDPYVKMCLDTGHCSCLGISPADAVHTIGKDHLKALHIHDNDGVADRHFLPYDGVTDWSAFAHALAAIDYDGVLSLEAIVSKTDDKALQEEREIDLFARLCTLDLTK